MLGMVRTQRFLRILQVQDEVDDAPEAQLPEKGGFLSTINDYELMNHKFMVAGCFDN